MEKINFALSLENAKKVPLFKFKKDFTFIVNGKEYLTSRYIADILSPNIRKFHFTDESINEISINTKLKSNKDYFNDFLNLSNFENYNLDKQQQNFFSEFFLKLGNIDGYFQIQPEYHGKITNENAVDLLISITQHFSLITKEFEIDHNIPKDSVSLYQVGNVQKIISFISSNFETVDKKRLNEIEIDLISQIITNSNLQISDEDSVLNFVIDLYEQNDSFSPLFEYVIFSNVTQESLIHFINKFNLEDMNVSIWKSICTRLVSKSGNVNKSRYLQNIIEFSHQNGIEFHGIMRYLTEKTGGNIHDNGTIDISSNSIWNDDQSHYHPKNLVDYEKKNYYDSKDDENTYICFDFKERSIQLTSYSIESENSDAYTGHLKNWIIEVSNDGKNWIEIDRHVNDGSLNGPSIVGTFKIRKSLDDFYQYVRLLQTGNTWYPYGNHNQFYFPLIEFYGKLKQPLA